MTGGRGLPRCHEKRSDSSWVKARGEGGELEVVPGRAAISLSSRSAGIEFLRDRPQATHSEAAMSINPTLP